MLTYNMDVTPESVWKRTTPSEAELAQPYYCTEAGGVLCPAAFFHCPHR